MTKIEWTNETWNPIIGCSKISEGCQNCYAEKMAFRLTHMPHTDYYSFVLDDNKEDDTEKFKYVPEWNGRTHFVESALQKPLKWKKPRMIFACSMGDLFHESVPFEWIDRVFETIVLNPQHTFQILTKRPERMLEYFKQIAFRVPINAWLGVTVENQEQLIKRVPKLLSIPAAKRFVSCEPLLSGLDFYGMQMGNELYNCLNGVGDISTSLTGLTGDKLDWVIVGGETGPKARKLQTSWVLNIKNQCKDAGVPFFFKSWGKLKKGSEIAGKEHKQLPK